MIPGDIIYTNKVIAHQGRDRFTLGCGKQDHMILIYLGTKPVGKHVTEFNTVMNSLGWYRKELE